MSFTQIGPPKPWTPEELAEWQKKGRRLDEIEIKRWGRRDIDTLVWKTQFDHMRRYLIALAAPAYGIGYMELRAIKRGAPIRRRWIPTASIGYRDRDGVRERFEDTKLLEDVFVWTKEAMRDGYEIFCGVLPRDSENGRKANIFQAGWAWADVDFKLGEGTDLEKEAFWIDKMSRMQGRYKPDMIVASGNGMHLYWRINPVVGFIGKGRAEAVRKFEENLGFWQQLAQPGADSTQDLARVLRLPGTLNQKDPENTKNVLLREMEPEPDAGHYEARNQSWLKEAWKALNNE